MDTMMTTNMESLVSKMNDGGYAEELLWYLDNVCGYMIEIDMRKDEDWKREKGWPWPRRFVVRANIPWTVDRHAGAGDTLLDATKALITNLNRKGHNGDADEYKGRGDHRCKYGTEREIWNEDA